METKDRSVSFSSSYETDLDEGNKMVRNVWNFSHLCYLETEEKTLSKCSNRLETYRRTCELLEITRDWQIEEFLSTNHLVLNDRPFSLKEIRALVSALDKNFQSLVLHSVGLNFRSIEILCRALRKCFNLNLLVRFLLLLRLSIRFCRRKFSGLFGKSNRSTGVENFRRNDRKFFFTRLFIVDRLWNSWFIERSFRTTLSNWKFTRN